MDLEWYYFMSYHPDLPNLIMRVERDEEFIAGLSVAIEKLLEDLQSNYEKIGVLNGI
jgi:predicted RNase H-like HicB family nuclease